MIKEEQEHTCVTKLIRKKGKLYAFRTLLVLQEQSQDTYIVDYKDR
jgi:hypothetical protein